MRFPPSFIERLRSHSLISEVIARRIPLKRHGREYQGLCPFHNEKSPSFTVNDAKGFFHCFGCGVHGDAIEFVRRYERLSYPEAIERLSREAGIPMPQLTREEAKKAEAEKTLHEALEAASQWFEKQLNASHGSEARHYLEKRGLTGETLVRFRIGYAPEDRTGLHQHLTKAGFSKALQAEAGLIIVPEEGNPYDRFRGRVIFPIRSASGKVIAFGGRLLAQSTNKNLPKYLNSPETPLFKKGELLFNLDLAKKAARDNNKAVVMEGYMDVVSTAQSGINYAVATLGTAVTPEHLRLLWQLAREPVMCLDGDAAGARAMMRAAEVALPLLKPGYSLRFATLPKGDDPDTYVQKHGKASFEKLLTAAPRLSQVVWEKLSPQYKLDAPEDRAALEDALKSLADKIAHPTVRNHYATYFRNLLWARKPARPQLAQERSREVEQLMLRQRSEVLEHLVQQLLSLLLVSPQLLHKSQVEDRLASLDIRSRALDGLRNTLLAAQVHADMEDGERFSAYIKAQAPEEALKILERDALKLPYREQLSDTDALQRWNETLSAYQLAHLEFELQELINHMPSEASYLRQEELQLEIRKMRQLQTFASAQTDVA